MPRHRSHSLEFKRQVVEEYLGGETLHGLAKRHDISRQLIRVGIEKYEGGAFDDDARAANLVQQYEARISHDWATRLPVVPSPLNGRNYAITGATRVAASGLKAFQSGAGRQFRSPSSDKGQSATIVAE